MKSPTLMRPCGYKAGAGMIRYGMLMLALGLVPVAAQAQNKTLRLEKTGNVLVQSIPLKPNTSVTILSDGNLKAMCNADDCGITSAGTAPTINSFADVTLTQGGTASADRLKWTTTGSEICYGVSPTQAGWNALQPTSNTTGLALNTLAVGTYDFKIRCYSATGGRTVDTQSWVSGVSNDAIARVIVQQGQSTGDYCQEYLTNLQNNNPSEYAKFQLYKAENRLAAPGTNFKRKTTDTVFSTKTGKVPGKDTGAIASLPGYLNDDEYVALSFVMDAASTPPATTFTGKFSLKMTLTSGGVLEHSVVATISPCPGDFRPRENGSEVYLSSYCRSVYTSSAASLNGNINGGTMSGLALCPTPVGKTMYLNLSLRDLSQAPANDPPPADWCTTGANCGAAFLLGDTNSN
jgi:hypothetical protein